MFLLNQKQQFNSNAFQMSFFEKDHSNVNNGGILFYCCLNANQNVLKEILCLSDPSTGHDAIYSIKGGCVP